MPNLRFAAAALLLAAPITLLAADTAAKASPNAGPKEAESRWVFSLLPKSLQQNPRLDITVITEMTEAGKKLPEVSPAKPMYFEPVNSGYKALGAIVANEKVVPEKEITRLLFQSLGSAGYLPGKAPEHPPTIAIVYTWGSHNLLVEGDEENPSLSPTAVARNLLDRAALVGGQKFSNQLRQAFEKADTMATASYAPPSDPTGTVPDIPRVNGPDQIAFLNPVELFRKESEKNDFLVDQTAHDVYYVVATAYDYASIAKNKPLLLWRTRMTVASSGVTQEQTLPTMIMTAGPYFGKEMNDVAILSKRAVRDGKVEVGTPQVIDAK